MVLRRSLAAIVAVAGLALAPAGASAIVGGTPVRPADHPWFAWVGDDDICAGALVLPDRLVTTAGCAEGAEGEIVRVGGVRRRVAGTTFPRAATRSIVRGSRVDCDDDRDDACMPDIALLHLAQRVFVPPLPLAGSVVGEAATVVGHGTTDNDPESQTAPARLRAAVLQAIADEECRRRYTVLDRAALRNLPAPVTVCAADPSPPHDAGICIGDGGAPLLADREGIAHLLGVGTYASGCGAQGAPSVFSDTWAHRGFVLDPAPVSRPWTQGDTRLTGRGRVGTRITCHAPRFIGRVDRVIYRFLPTFEDPPLQHGPKRTYVVRRRDRGEQISCWAFAVNAGGASRAVGPFGKRTITVR